MSESIRRRLETSANVRPSLHVTSHLKDVPRAALRSLRIQILIRFLGNIIEIDHFLYVFVIHPLVLICCHYHVALYTKEDRF